ncbi:hypothetical protein, conserved [Leishmania tarentolae]|uniref:Uncharacterized protein n=1 Tax=Leishmania tarentolae TaxID=5689 RepID=A0A640KQ06_LEITA|nr:hypothetical protein, conserved [Leishmania tarentolae]
MSSSPASTERANVKDVLVLAAAATTIVGYASSVYWERSIAPRLLRCRELTLEQEIAELEKEAEKICTASNLFEHGRLTRRVVRLRQELEAERRKRLAYECSVVRVFSPLLRVVPVASWLGRSTPDTEAVAAAPRRAGKAIADSKSGASADPFSTTTTSSPTSIYDDKYLNTAARRLVLLAISGLDVLWYNTTTIVKYLLRFGGALALLCTFGNQSGIMAVPLSFNEVLRYGDVGVIAPLLLNFSMYMPALVFAPPRSTVSANTHGSRGADADPGISHINFTETMQPASSASSVGALTSTASDAGAKASFQFAGNRFCASNGLVSWLLACYLACYLIVRVLA